MSHDAKLFDLLTQGRLENVSSKPKVVETVLSRVFIFEDEDLVLKFYKRDNDWWNNNMRDISGGEPRNAFIKNDFAYNNRLNPEVYVALKKPMVENDVIRLVDAQEGDDDLVIVMRMAKVDNKLTHVATNGSLTEIDYKEIGRQFASAKLSLPNELKREIPANWYESLKDWIHGLHEWSGSVPDFPAELRERALVRVNELFERNYESFSKIGPEEIAVLIDCNLENLIYHENKLSFIDIFPPKELWESGAFEMDVYRVATDIHILAGKEAYESFMKGAIEVAGKRIDERTATFYLLFGAMITGPYLYMIGGKDPAYLEKAKKANAFIESLLA